MTHPKLISLPLDKVDETVVPRIRFQEGFYAAVVVFVVSYVYVYRRYKDLTAD